MPATVTDPDTATVPPPSRSPWRTWRLGLGVLIAVRLVGEVVPLMGPTGWLWTTRIAELWLVAGLLAWAWKEARWREIGPSVGRVRSLAIGVAVVAIGAGQYVGVGPGVYPFVKWNMYTSGAEEVTYGEVWLIDSGGLRQRLVLEDIGLSTEPRAISGRLLEEAEAAAGGDAAARSLLTETLGVLVDRSASPPPDEFEIRRCVVTDPTLATPARCEIVMTVEPGQAE